MLATIGTRRVFEASPKLQLSKKLLPKAAGEETAPQLLKLTYVDGTESVLDLSQVDTKRIIESIELENGRLDTEALSRGKPW